MTISRGTNDKLKTVIGKNCLLMAYVHVAHDCSIGNNCVLVNAVQVAGHVNIDDWAIIGGASAVHQFVKVGAHVMVSGARSFARMFLRLRKQPVNPSPIAASIQSVCDAAVLTPTRSPKSRKSTATFF